ncbi:MAG: sialidase family protein [Chitinophagales bacterium]|nr:glycoside hydrolase [Chitinophagales bacterium]MDW8393228.1 sialidase family protein [Chitinophagales bacterium]
MMKFFLVGAVLLLGTIGRAQVLNVLVDGSGNPNEPAIWINPKNTQHLVAGANLNNVYVSFDGGLTWQQSTLTSSYGVWGDPCLITDTAGHFYFFHLSNPPNGNWIDRIVCQKSTDGGLTWTNGTYMGLNGARAQDKEWAVVDPATNAIYVTWTQFDDYGSSNPNDSSVILFSRSLDGGLTWSPAVRINKVAGNCIDSDDTAEGAVPAVGPNGEIYVAWSNRDTIYFDRSLDGGITWMEHDLVISEQPGGWDYKIPGIYRCNGLPVTKCDLSGGPYHGTIYVNWTDQRNGIHDTDVFLSKSTDGGLTWSAPVRVNDDTTQRHQFFSWMDIDQVTGHIYIVFYDRREHSNQNTDVYLAVSTDGGETFTNQKISNSPFNPSASVFFGDYTNISAQNGTVAAIWTRMDGLSTSIWAAVLNLATGLPQQDPGLLRFGLDPVFPNPTQSKAILPVSLSEFGYYTLSVHHVTGQPAWTVFRNRLMEAGRHQVEVELKKAAAPPGLYYCVFGNERKFLIQKLEFFD